jgi:hypothetical protein
MPRALIINPWVIDFKLYDEWMHPLGLYLLTSLLRHNGVDTAYFNCLDRGLLTKDKHFGTGDFPSVQVDKPPIYRSIHRYYRRFGVPFDAMTSWLSLQRTPDVIFVGSGMTYWLHGVAEAVAAVRTVFPDVAVVIGGVGATLAAPSLRRLVPDAHVCEGPLLDAIGPGKDAIPCLSRLTAQGWVSDLTLGLLASTTLRHAPVLATLGCSMRCAYCASHALQGQFVQRPIAQVVHEIAWARLFGVEDFAFYDDALLYRPEEVLFPLLRGVAEAGLTCRFHTPNGLHVKWMTPATATAMKSAGFRTMRFGYESSSHHDATCSKASRQSLATMVEVVTEAGFPATDLGVYVMAGLPDQLPAHVREELRFVASLGARPKPVFLSPVPRTAVFDHYAAMFPQLTEDPLWHNDAFFVSQLPGWSYEAMEEIRQEARELAGNGGTRRPGRSVGAQ